MLLITERRSGVYSLDDSLVPDYEPKDSDMEYSDDSGDYDKQVQQLENDYISDSTDHSDILPMYDSLPALQRKKKKIQNNRISSTVSSSHSGPAARKVTVQCSNNMKDKRLWDKVHFCYYCGLSSTNISKHYLGPHKSESVRASFHNTFCV